MDHNSQHHIALIGLGYVGLPLAVALARAYPVIGYDASAQRVQELRAGCDRTKEIEAEALRNERLVFTGDAAEIKNADVIIVAVPTPVDSAKRPDLSPLENACRVIGENMSRGAIVVFESTVYPGLTEEICGPLLESHSGMKCGEDFFLGYSPERINPGDKQHTLENVVKVVAAQTPETLEIIAAIYETVVAAGVHRAPSIMTAEAAKVIENTQRDLNIALINELAMIFNCLGLDTLEVLEAAGTKWNFLPFRPGLVGGHCIGVDPYYLTYKAEQIGYHPQIILAGRRINDGMGEFIARKLLELMIQSDIRPKNARIGVLGLTFKENLPDLRNTRVVDILAECHRYGMQPLVHDPWALPKEARELYQVELSANGELNDLNGVIVAVAHREYVERGAQWIEQILKPNAPVVDVKGIFNKDQFPNRPYWRL
ncbi:nucleotide sugar dehydrogenase [Candidatus Sumerlaeota bacterium]|nr:nucleotide sugar dehydrogenase [Candidatus Sumerlaeota bacterium]